MTQLKCSFCGYTFAEEIGHAACRGCLLSRWCRRVKCPNCGFELAVAPHRRRKEEEGRVREAQ
ncbi:MAG TPA: hypothetical protein GX511_05030 [Firmicutes bacterium]|nr:hypothetical protein [Bacillota bacterium]